jgi:hypothetical protein
MAPDVDVVSDAVDVPVRDPKLVCSPILQKKESRVIDFGSPSEGIGRGQDALSACHIGVPFMYLSFGAG